MNESDINTSAATFAAKVNGTLETYRDLHIVTFDFKQSPSVAYWLGQQAIPTEIMHFLKAEIRDDRIRQLKEQQDQKIQVRIWSVTITDSTQFQITI